MLDFSGGAQVVLMQVIMMAQEMLMLGFDDETILWFC